MKHRHWSRLALVALAAAACGVAAAPAAAAPAAPPAAASGPAATATAYLQARAAAVTAADPATVLAPWVAPGAPLAGAERAIARGTALRGAQQGHRLDVLNTNVEVLSTTVGEAGATATVIAHVITTTIWRSLSMVRDTEASGMDHDVSLQLVDGSWRVVGDKYYDVMVPGYLEAAGAPPAALRAAAKRLERASLRIREAKPVVGRRWVVGSSSTRRYNDILKYNRSACCAYADYYALSYCPTYVRFGADCANFVSQAARQGAMPVDSGAYSYGWWYDKKSTATPTDDSYSLSWINVTKQMAWWNARRSDWVSSINALGRGDFVYYDWSGDGFWDHVAVVVGTNSAGQKIVDAHTTDYYHTYWKMGYSSTAYKFARVRDQWVV